MDRAALGRVLLDLVGTETNPDLEPLTEHDWTALNRIAGLHRLEVLLHAMHQQSPAIPAEIAAQWFIAHRRGAMEVMVWQSELAETFAKLEAAGYAPVALKGAWLAAYAYPEPVQRPLRDIDLLLPADQVLPAWRMLVEDGCVPIQHSKLSLEDHARLEQHMPPLTLPRGTVLELHSRISELSGRLEYATPAGNEAELLARAVTIDGIRYPEPTDMLAHLVIHAVYGHRLDCGPLLLSDVYFLIKRHPVDWARFWQAANTGKWAAGAALVFALVRAAHGAKAVPDDPAEPEPPSPDMLALAQDLLVQDYEAKTYARLAAALATGGFGYAWRRLTGRVAGGAESTVLIDRKAEGGRIGWAVSRIGAMARDLANPEVRAEARRLARFRRWLEP